jgi:hypothetical protein
MGPKCYTETSVRNYHYTLRDVPEERRSHLLRDGILESSKVSTCFSSSYICLFEFQLYLPVWFPAISACLSSSYICLFEFQLYLPVWVPAISACFSSSYICLFQFQLYLPVSVPAISACLSSSYICLFQFQLYLPVSLFPFILAYRAIQFLLG